MLFRASMARKLPASSPVLKRQVERYMRTVNVASNDAYVHQVTQIVAMALPRGEGRADTIARYLGTGRRTLHRRLERVGANFSPRALQVFDQSQGIVNGGVGVACRYGVTDTKQLKLSRRVQGDGLRLSRQ